MPVDRFLHPRLGHSDKVTMLTDLEFRVWTQYILSADDAGIMRMSPLTLQADNDALAKRPAKMIERALESMIAIGLLKKYEAQGRRYVCSANWQDFQHVQWPRATQNPMPPEALLVEFTPDTRFLLEKILKKSSGDHAKGHRLEAIGTKATGTEAQGFDRFWDSYPRKVNKDAARREFDKLAPDNDLLDRMVTAVQEQRASAQWQKDSGQFIPHARTWIHQRRWTDELAAVANGKLAVGHRGLVPDDEPL